MKEVKQIKKCYDSLRDECMCVEPGNRRLTRILGDAHGLLLKNPSTLGREERTTHYMRNVVKSKAGPNGTSRGRRLLLANRGTPSLGGSLVQCGGETHALDIQTALNSAQTTAPSCPARVRRKAPVATLQIRAELSWDVVTMNIPQGEKAADVTQSSCPISDIT